MDRQAETWRVTFRSAPEMTQYFCEYGGKNMGNGIRRALRVAGLSGAVKGSILTAGAFFLGIELKKAWDNRQNQLARTKQAELAPPEKEENAI